MVVCVSQFPVEPAMKDNLYDEPQTRAQRNLSSYYGYMIVREAILDTRIV